MMFFRTFKLTFSPYYGRRRELQTREKSAFPVTCLIETKSGNSHRGNLDIIADMLDASHGGVKKTCLMYRCNLSFRQLKYYSVFLVRSGLLRTVNKVAESDAELYQVTEKGKRFLKAYKGLKKLMG
jgi:predicted transcriptional regulator